jgi:hypothetical protein
MLWHKSWLDTRWPFLIGIGVLALMSCGTVFDYPRVARLVPTLGPVDPNAPLARFIQDTIDLERTYRGFIWHEWFRQNLAQTWTFFAVLLGSAGLVASGGALFTLSLPVSRQRLFAVRALTAFSELFVLAFVPSLLIPLLSPLVGQRFGLADLVICGLCLFVSGSVFYSLTTYLSTIFADIWRPLLIGCAAAVAAAFVPELVPGLSVFAVFHAMSAESYIRGTGIPWAGLLASALASSAFVYGAAVNFDRRDF